MPKKKMAVYQKLNAIIKRVGVKIL